MAWFHLIPKDSREQALRMRRTLMAAGSNLTTAAMGVIAYFAGLLTSIRVLAYFLLGIAVFNLIFLTVVRSGLNLRLRDPSMTFAQSLVPGIPALYLIYHLNAARPAFVFLAAVPFIYGSFQLRTRRLAVLAAMYVFGYVAVVAVLAVNRPAVVTPVVELLMVISLAAVLSQLALLGGYLRSLRARLDRQNRELQHALTRIEELATHDELTGVHNRRSLNEFLKHEVDRAERGGGPFCVAIMDLDYFKQVNDTWGHSVGDSVLVRASSAMMANLREADRFGRYGGEEFLAIFVDTTLDEASVVAERLRAAVAAVEIPELPGETGLTVSIGLAEWQRGDDPETLTDRADRALYEAKRKGRNRVSRAA